MKGGYVIAGLVFLVLAGLVGADYLTTTVSSDGSILIKTAGSDENGSFASRVMTVDTAGISRSVENGENSGHEVSVQGSGPMLVSDYAHAEEAKGWDPSACVFLTGTRAREMGRSELYTSGILNNGRYQISRETGSGLVGVTEVNGTGMMGFGSASSGNRSLISSGFITGNMTLRDFVRYGGKI
jgi:hypothetical protein